jgi:DNA-binding transcriptional ArsR family regulator
LNPVLESVCPTPPPHDLDLLRARAKTTTEIVDAFPDMTPHAVMKHIDVLRDVGLINTREDGRRRINS